MRKYLIPLGAILLAFLCWSFVAWQKTLLVTPETRVSEVLHHWGGSNKSHVRVVVDAEKAAIGKQLVYNGWAIKNGKKSKVISTYFTCTNCHNQVIEDENLSNPTPEARLSKAVKQKLPFLQGTTFYGTANRTSWYNDDYYLKYGSLVASAKDTLENAIQLCAKVCSSGRYLDSWELEAIVQYYNTIDYKIKDLGLRQEEYDQLNSQELSFLEKSNLLKSKYKSYSGATFLDIIPKKKRKLGAEGDPGIGKEIFVQSCMACHGYDKEFTSFKLDTTNLSISFLKKYVHQNHPYSMYSIVRKGTVAEFAIREYMPHYTAQRMSEQQLEDLVSYILF